MAVENAKIRADGNHAAWRFGGLGKDGTHGIEKRQRKGGTGGAEEGAP
jgi:hypothetical protein